MIGIAEMFSWNYAITDRRFFGKVGEVRAGLDILNP
jgi:hypothetical protein